MIYWEYGAHAWRKNTSIVFKILYKNITFIADIIYMSKKWDEILIACNVIQWDL